MIVGIGVDLVKIERIDGIIKKYGERFLKKVFSEEELKNKKNIHEISGKFASKEAFVKAIGTGFNGQVFFSDVKVLNDQRGRPFLDFSDKVKKSFNIGNVRTHLTITHDGDYAIAMVVLEEI